MKNELLLLRIRNIIAEREFNTAHANHETSRDGWTFDHAQVDIELNRIIVSLLEQAEIEKDAGK